MKKLTTIAVAAALAAPMAVMADTTLYGIVDTAMVHNDNGSIDDWGVGGNYSRIGVKGSEDLGNGLKAIFQYEWATDNVGGGIAGAYGGGLLNRLGYVGLSGGFGTITAGRQGVPWGATHAQVGNYDPAQGSLDNDLETTCANCTDMAPARTGSSVAYTSPNMNGFTATVAMVVDGGNRNTSVGDDGVDSAHISLRYSNGPLSVALAAMDFDSQVTTASDMWAVSAGYNFGNFYVGAQYEDRDASPDGATADDADYVGIGAKAFFGNNTVFVSYGDRDSDTNSEDRESWAVGINHAFSKRTMVYADYTDTEAGGSTDTSTFALGLRHSF